VVLCSSATRSAADAQRCAVADAIGWLGDVPADDLCMHAAREAGPAALAALAARAEAEGDFWAAARLYALRGRVSLGATSRSADSMFFMRRGLDVLIQLDRRTLQTQWLEVQLQVFVLCAFDPADVVRALRGV
jgi:hypothetical protein